MRTWRLIVSQPSDGPGNMSSDEAVFLSAVKNESFQPTIRFYTWDKPCVTFGYFQKFQEFSQNPKNLEVTRRPTGGLAVFHGKDISYSIVTNKTEWPYVYNQEESYAKFHLFFKEILNTIGIPVVFYESKLQPPAGNPLCVQTFYPHDLHLKGKKIVGSSQRRRGEVLLQQGSIHIEPAFFDKFCAAAPAAIKKTLGINLVLDTLNGSELASKATLLTEKYTTTEWNQKF